MSSKDDPASFRVRNYSILAGIHNEVLSLLIIWMFGSSQTSTINGNFAVQRHSTAIVTGGLVCPATVNSTGSAPGTTPVSTTTLT